MILDILKALKKQSTKVLKENGRCYDMTVSAVEVSELVKHVEGLHEVLLAAQWVLMHPERTGRLKLLKDAAEQFKDLEY